MKTSRLWVVLAVLFAGSEARAVDTLGVTPVKTPTKSSVQSQMSGADGATLGQVSSNNTAQAGAGTGGMFTLPALVQSTLPTYSTNGNMVALTVDGSGRLYITTDAATNLGTNIAQVNGATPSATNPLFDRLTDGTTAYVAAKTGQFPTSLGQTTKSGSLSVTLASDQGALSVSTGVPTGATSNRATPVNIASAATSTIVCKSGLAVSQPLKIYRAAITAAAQVRCTLQYNDNGTITKFGDAVTSPGLPSVEKLFNGFANVTTSATATIQQVEAVCTNFDSFAEDVGCDVSYCQSASGC